MSEWSEIRVPEFCVLNNAIKSKCMLSNNFSDEDNKENSSQLAESMKCSQTLSMCSRQAVSETKTRQTYFQFPT